MVSRYSRILMSVMVVLTILLASCSSGGNNNNQGSATNQVPGTGLTAAPTSGMSGTTETVTPAAGTTGTAASGTTGTGTPAAGTTGTAAAGTTGTGTPAAGTTGTPAAGATTGTPAAGGAAGGVVQTTPWKGEKIGGTVKVLAIWGGTELDNFNAMIKPFEDQTGIKVQVETTRDIGNVLNTRIQGGNPPDVAGIPNPGQLVTLAKAGSLKPLDQVLDMNMMKQQYDQGFINLASVDGKMYGIFTKAAVKSLVWYSPKAFQAKNYQVPKTWDDLQALEQQMIKDGVTPWCVGIDGGAGSGWPGTDWVEDILLHQSGPETYDKWVQHQIPWTDPAVKQAWDTFGKIVNDPKMVFGGPQAVVATQFGQAFNPMFQNPPKCYMHKQANFITSFFTDQFKDLKAGTDYNFFTFPAPNPQYANTLEVAGDLFGMFNDTPQARALIQYLVTPDAQSIWASKGGFLSANKGVDPKVYPDDITRQIGQMLTTASSVRFDASDQMPQPVENAFSQGVLQYPGNPGQLDSILQNIESQASESYTK